MKKIYCLLLLLLCCTHCFSQLQEDLSLKYLVQPPAAKTANAHAIILLHGYGSNEQDLFELKSAFPGNYFIISARAPYPLGSSSYQWFALDGNNRQAQVENSRDLILKFIGQVVAKYGIDPHEVYLSGFSQGAMMSYEVGLTHPEAVKGIGVLSGRLFPSLKQEISRNTALQKLKIFIAHGIDDERIPFIDGKQAYEYLVQIGLKPDFHGYPGMGHAISKDVMKDLVQWLK